MDSRGAGRHAAGGRRCVPGGWRAVLALLLVAAGCGTARPPEGVAPARLFEWAQERFDDGDYGAAIRGYQQFVIRDPLSAMVDSAQYMVGESYLRQGQELLAVTEFEQLATTRPNSPLADDAQFGLCRAYWELSPDLPLEQEDTRSAAEQCQRLIQFFPESEWVERAREIRREAGAKLASKAYRVGQYYFERQLYESANIYFEKALEESPEAPVIPEVLAALYRSYRRVGFDTEAEAVRRRLLLEFPETEEARRLRDAGREADAPPGASSGDGPAAESRPDSV